MALPEVVVFLLLLILATGSASTNVESVSEEPLTFETPEPEDVPVDRDSLLLANDPLELPDDADIILMDDMHLALALIGANAREEREAADGSSRRRRGLGATSAAPPMAEPASSVEPRSHLRANSRRLSYACGSKNSGQRRLLDRILLHPCESNHRQTSNINDAYKRNSSSSTGSSTFVNVSLGIIAGVLSILALLYFIDRETFTEITGVRKLPGCSSRSVCCRSVPDLKRLGQKPQMSMNEEEPSPYERDAYLTEETADYLAAKRDQEVEQPRRKLKSIFWCCFKAKTYGDGDKYHIPWTDTQEEEENAPKGFGPNVNKLLVLWEDVRLRFCWRPTRDYSNEEHVKYAIDMAPTRDSIKIAASSYETADAGSAPWSIGRIGRTLRCKK